MNKLIITIIFLFFTSHGELSLICSENIEENKNIRNSQSLITYIDSRHAILNNNLNSTYNTSIIDSSWDTNFNYFILYKRGKITNYSDIDNQGTILHDDKKFIIFKTQLDNLRDHNSFIKFDIVKLHNTPLKPYDPHTAINTINRQFSETINTLVNSVNIDTLWNMIRQLQNKERYTYSSESNNTAEYLVSYLQNFNMDTVYTDKYLSTGAPNIIAEKKGTEKSENIILICGHYDIAKSGYPGADDNGSGSAGNLEIARILSSANFKNTIRFALFSGEELGLLGSDNYAQKVQNKGENIIAVFNLDMISYLKPGDPLSLDVCYNNQSSSLYESYVNIAYQYLPDLNICDSKNSPWKNSSDHKSFWDRNYPALYFGDDLDPGGPEHPNFHTLADTLGNGANSKDYLEGVVKSVTAAVATLAEPGESVSTTNGNINKSNITPNITCEQSSKLLKITNKSNEDINISIFTLNGKLIRNKNVTSNSVTNFSELGKGNYILDVKSKSNNFTKNISID